MAEQTYLAIQFCCKNSKSLCVQIQFSANWVIAEFSEIHNQCGYGSPHQKLSAADWKTKASLSNRNHFDDFDENNKWRNEETKKNDIDLSVFFVSMMKYLPCKLIRSAIRAGINQTLGMILGLRRGKK